MVGRELVDRFPKRERNIGEIAFEVRDWVVYDPLDEDRIRINKVNFNVRRGEVVGFSGLMGAGRTELAMSIFGKAYGKKISGTIIKDGKEVQFHSVSQAIDNGVAYLTEDRKTAGLVLIDDIRRNVSLAGLKKISKNFVVNEHRETEVALEYIKKLNIKCSNMFQKTENLSGGNQQKVVISKWIFAGPDVLILDEPTRGIDVGAKYEIYSIINQLAAEGKSIVMISSEMPEILGMCDRIYVLNEGRVVGELDREEASQENIMGCIIRSSDRN